MNWEAIGAVGEIIGALAVLISLIYLALQVRQNTMVMRAAAKQNLTEASQNLIYKMVENSSHWVKLISGEEAASAEEQAEMSLLVRAMLRGFESQCYHYEAGLLEEEEWQALRNAIQSICALPGVHRYWLELKPHISARLHAVIEGTR